MAGILVDVDQGPVLADLALLGTVALVILPMLADGVYQLLTGRQALLPFERALRHRAPASQFDCAIQGSAKVLQALSLIFLIGGSALMLVSTAAHLPPLVSLPLLVQVAYPVALLGSLFLSVVCMLSAFALTRRITYVKLDQKVATH